jgi:hypothetical protein
MGIENRAVISLNKPQRSGPNVMQLHARANGAVLTNAGATFSHRIGVSSMKMTDEMKKYLFNVITQALNLKFDFALDNLFEAIDRTGYDSRDVKEALNELRVAHAASSFSSSHDWAFLDLMDELPPFNPDGQCKAADA